MRTAAALLILASAAHAQSRQPDTLRAGDAAPDFKAKVIGEKKEVQLSEVLKQGKPVVLIFGSYT